MLKSGGQWRMLPRDYPKWRTCHSYFQQWSEAQAGGLSLLEAALKKLVSAVRHSDDRNAHTRFIIIDAPNVTSCTASP